MEFFIFLCFMSFVSFAVAFLAYGLVIRLLGTASSASRYAQIILVPVAIIGYDFLTIRRKKIKLNNWSLAGIQAVKREINSKTNNCIIDFEDSKSS